MSQVQNVEQQAESAARSPAMKTVAALGIVVLGVVHLLIGWLALQIAWGNSNEQADPAGAFATLADQPLGSVVLWVSALGLLALAVWQVSEAIWGETKTWKRWASVAKAVGYVVLAILATRIALGDSGSSGGSNEESATATLLTAPAGPFLVGAIGLAIVAAGGYLAYKGLARKFVKHLDSSTTSGRSGDTVIWLGVIGFVAKGVACVIIGALVLTAAVTHDPEQSGGLDDALKTLRDQPYGQWLLTAVALGLAAFGVYAFAWARSMKASA